MTRKQKVERGGNERAAYAVRSFEIRSRLGNKAASGKHRKRGGSFVLATSMQCNEIVMVSAANVWGSMAECDVLVRAKKVLLI